MKRVPRRCPAGGFSLVELLIAVLILGIGLLLIAGAFPVGLRFHQESVDETVSGLLARSAVNQISLLRTHAGHNEYYSENAGYRDFYGHLCVAECFENTTHVQYLFDTSGGKHTGDAGRPGQVLSDQGLGADINEWLPSDERVCFTDPRYGYQVFYQWIADPGTKQIDGSKTFSVYVVVQKADSEATQSDPWDRMPKPSGELAVTAVNSDGSIVLSGGFAVREGAAVVRVDNGSWYWVSEVKSQGIVLNRGAAGLAGKTVRVINNATLVVEAVVNKQFVR
jgi:prepilin-type N-terminal cleavage/methylation domain-containing protein